MRAGRDNDDEIALGSGCGPFDKGIRLSRPAAFDTGGAAANMMRILVETLKLPLTAFIYSMEMLVRTMQGLQKIADQGIDVMMSGTVQTYGDQPERESDPKNDETISVAERAVGDSTQTTPKEEIKMSDIDDKDLSGDDLKLVRYKILFIKRDHEYAFPEQEDLVSADIDEAGFTAWKIAEFIQRLDKIEIPEKWSKKKYPLGHTGKYIHKLNEDDKQYLRVFYQVLDRFPRESADYEAEQIRVLEQIRDELALSRPPAANVASTSLAGGSEEAGRGKRS